MEAVGPYSIKSENDHLIDPLSPNGVNGSTQAYHNYQAAQSQLLYGVHAQWSPQIHHSEYPYATATAYGHGHPIGYPASTSSYLDPPPNLYHHHQPQSSSSTTTESRAGNPVSIPVAISAAPNSLGYPAFVSNGGQTQAQVVQSQQTQAQAQAHAQAQQQPQTQQQQQQAQSLNQQQQHQQQQPSRPPSVVHSPMHHQDTPASATSTSTSHSTAFSPTTSTPFPSASSAAFSPASAFSSAAFSSRGRSTSYSGPYLMLPGILPNGSGSGNGMMSNAGVGDGGFSIPLQFQHSIMARMNMTPMETTSSNNAFHMMNANTLNVNANGMNINGNLNANGMTSPTSLVDASSASTSYDYIQEDRSPTSSMGMSVSNGNTHTGGGGGQYRPITPGSGGQNMYGYLTPPATQQLSHLSSQFSHHQNQQHRQALPPPIPPLASSVATGGAPTIPRSMSMGNIPGHSHGGGAMSPSRIGGRTTPSGAVTPGSTLSLTPGSALSRSTASRLGRGIGLGGSLALGGVPSLTIPSNLYDHRTPEYDTGCPGGGMGSSGVVSPSTSTVLSSLIRNGGSGPGTASNGGSVPLTPTTDDTAPLEYNHYGSSSLASFSRAVGGIGASGVHMNSTGSGGGGGSEKDEDLNDEEDEDEKMTMALPSNLSGPNGSPRRGVGVTRTEKKRRSTTIAAGPSAAVGVSRSRSGTMVNGASVGVGVGGLGLISSSGLGGASLTMSPVDMHGSALPGMGLGMLGSPASASSGVVGGANANANVGTANTSVSVMGGQANSPLAMKELSPAHKPMIETYLNRYLNYLCVNPNAKDRMGHQIHQMYTARRIQRYEQLYGWRPLKFRIEAFVNGFVDLLTASGLSQDVTMKIPHYLNNSRLFSRFNESGNRMKSQGQTIWRVRARCRSDIPGADAPSNGAFHHHSPSAFSQQQQQQIRHHQQQAHHQQIQQQQQQVHHQQTPQHEITTNGLMMAPEPLLWEFLPYERSIVGQPPLAIVGTAWQWNMKVHDHWTPRKKVSWSFSSNATSSDTGNGSAHDGSDNSSPLSASASSSSSNALPRWLSLQGSKLKGTPTEPGVYPISIEATFQEDNDPEPVVVRGNYTIQVSKAIGSWKNKVALPQDGTINSPEGGHTRGGSSEMGYGNESGAVGGLGGGNAGPGDGTGDAYPSLIGQRMDQLKGMYGANQGSTRGFASMPYPYGYVH